MNLNELLPAGGIEALATQLGIPREQAQRGAEALLPSVLGGMGDNRAQLDAHVNTLGGADLAANVLGTEPRHSEPCCARQRSRPDAFEADAADSRDAGSRSSDGARGRPTGRPWRDPRLRTW
jgi:hypothetical protein